MGHRFLLAPSNIIKSGLVRNFQSVFQLPELLVQSIGPHTRSANVLFVFVTGHSDREMSQRPTLPRIHRSRVTGELKDYEKEL